MGKDPLEIAYGRTVGTHPELTKGDFDVGTESGPREPREEDGNGGDAEQNRHGLSLGDDDDDDDDSPLAEASRQWAAERENSGPSHSTNPQFGLDGEDEFRNVWGR